MFSRLVTELVTVRLDVARGRVLCTSAAVTKYGQGPADAPRMEAGIRTTVSEAEAAYRVTLMADERELLGP
jgi:hypothetical protein